MLGCADLQNVARVIARVAGLICNVPCQYGGVVTIHYTCKTVLTQYDRCHIVPVLCLQSSHVHLGQFTHTAVNIPADEYVYRMPEGGASNFKTH